MLTPSEEYRTIPLTKGQVAIVDLADFDWLNQWKWHAAKSGGTYYASRAQRRETIAMSRAIMGLVHGDTRKVDHRDGNTLDNRRSNLRVCTSLQNTHNQKKRVNNLSGFKGVYWRKDRRRWRATITLRGRKTTLGIYPTAEEAHRAYCEAAIRLHGEFARFE